MLKKINRGLRRKDFEVSRLDGVMYQTPLFGVSVIKNKLTTNNFQVGFVISKKISKKAVERNKIRRRLTESVYKLITNYELRITNLKIIFLVKTSTLNASVEEIDLQVKNVFEKINITQPTLKGPPSLDREG